MHRNEYRRMAHEEVEEIFREILPQAGMKVREEQITLCHQMLSSLCGNKIALCDAAVGVGKTYAYLVACILFRKYSQLLSGYFSMCGQSQPIVISTSSIALQEAMEYTKERYGETEYVFVKKDDPTKPYQYGMIQAQVMRMIRQKDIRDDNGELLKFGTHIFRHCYGKKLTELHIEDWMIARLLGHKTLQSVHHYRRIGNKVMADETRKTREKMDLILMDIIKGWDGYEL